jgi:hypothetical protein
MKDKTGIEISIGDIVTIETEFGDHLIGKIEEGLYNDVNERLKGFLVGKYIKMQDGEERKIEGYSMEVIGNMENSPQLFNNK